MIERLERYTFIIVVRYAKQRVIRIFHRNFADMAFRIVGAVFLTYGRGNIILRPVQKLRIHCPAYDLSVVRHEIREIISHDLTIHFHDRRRGLYRFRDFPVQQRQLRVFVCQRIFDVLDDLRHADQG